MSWEKSVAIGATFQETDETITHQIVDRPEVPNQYLSRSDRVWKEFETCCDGVHCPALITQ